VCSSQSSEEDLFNATDVGFGGWSWLDETEELAGAVAALLLLLELNGAWASADEAADLAEGVGAHEGETAGGGRP